MGMILRIASSRIVGQGDIVGRSGYFSLNLSANSVMRGRLDARRTLKSLVADLRVDVPAEGTSYALVCINAHVDWSGIWLNSVQVDGQNLALDEEKHIAEGEWGRIVCKDKYLNMDITPNTTGKERVIEVTPTQIGYFYYFKLTQQPLPVKQNP